MAFTAALVFLVIQALTFSNGQLSGCNWVGSDNKYNPQCASGQVARGFCGSGEDRDCRNAGRNAHTTLNCCNIAGNITSTHNPCYDMDSSSHGEALQCRPQHSVSAVCGSGGRKDCGYNVAKRIRCCKEPRIAMSCRPSRHPSGYGRPAECDSNAVMVGMCSSGGNADCQSGGGRVYNVAYCCPLQSARDESKHAKVHTKADKTG